jgi:transcriptional/translational regulatory protein YebC/TACO1
LKTQEKMLDVLEEDDDVQDVFHNAEFPDGFEG